MSDPTYDPTWDEWSTKCGSCRHVIHAQTVEILNLKLQYHAAIQGCEKYDANQTH